MRTMKKYQLLQTVTLSVICFFMMALVSTPAGVPSNSIPSNSTNNNITVTKNETKTVTKIIVEPTEEPEEPEVTEEIDHVSEMLSAEQKQQEEELLKKDSGLDEEETEEIIEQEKEIKQIQKTLTLTVSKDGNVTLGKNFAGKRVRVTFLN
jgi:hypothetical protein